MPKKGLTNEQWTARLREYARGEFKFGPGQHPRPNSRWSLALKRIEACALFNVEPGSRDPFGNELTCTCLYHKVFFCLNVLFLRFKDILSHFPDFGELFEKVHKLLQSIREEFSCVRVIIQGETIFFLTVHILLERSTKRYFRFLPLF